jgi:exodeoxyribonuclease VII large subunit
LSDSTLAESGTSDYTVLSLNIQVRNLLKMAFPYPVWLRGEVSSVPKPNSRGHIYFQLIEPGRSGKQPESSLDCVLFAGSKPQVVRDFARDGLSFELEEGMAVRILGNIDVWPPGGRYQFVVQAVDPVWTRGEQSLHLRRLLEELTESGVLGENSTLAIPRVPLRIGLVTAENSAACRDFLQTLRESGYPFSVFAAWAPMQGKSTSASVVKAFNSLLSVPDLDVLVLTRGGGSATDLNWFNDESIARTIAQLPWPVISGIGHETDTTLPDYAAHTRAKTPTHAASILVNMVADFAIDLDSLSMLLARGVIPCLRTSAEKLSGLKLRMRNSLESSVLSASRRLDSLVSRLSVEACHSLHTARAGLKGVSGNVLSTAVLPLLRVRSAELDSITDKLSASLAGLIHREQLNLEKLSAFVDRRDPEKMLELGWAIVRRGRKGGMLTSVKEVSRSEEIDITLRDGSLTASVTEIHDKGVTNG